MAVATAPKPASGPNGIMSDVDTNPFAASNLKLPQQTIFRVSIVGTAKMLFHRYSCESVETKAKSAKGSATKKTDDLESYVYRDEDNHLCVPAQNLHASLVESAKSFQDPRSPRKSAHDLFEAGILVQPDMIRLKNLRGSHCREWDFLDTRRVVIGQAAVSRTRPGMEAGWTLEADIHILQPGLISAELFRNVLVNAGASVGLCDFRPQFGRYQIVRAEEIKLK